MPYYPIFLDVRGQRTIVVGGGKVAERKVRKLLRAGADVRVISPKLTPRLAQWVAEKRISVVRRRYRKGDISAAPHRDVPLLVFAATNDPAAQRAVREDARAAGSFVNVASDPAQCDFLVPASFTHGELNVAVSTSGTNPSLARGLRLRLQRFLGEERAPALQNRARKIKRQKSKGKSQK